MSILAIVHPTTLLGQELREQLDQRPDLWKKQLLLSPSDEEIGVLTETRGAAQMVGQVDAASLQEADVVFFCGGIEESRPWFEELGDTAAVILSPDAEEQDGVAVVSGVNLDVLGEGDQKGRRIVSPQPSAVVLAHLLHPLKGFAPRSAAATILQPISTYDKPALDEVFEQSRAVMTFASDAPREIFPVQMPFNIIPLQREALPVHGTLQSVLGEDSPQVAVQGLQAGIFHGFSVSLFVELDKAADADSIRRALGEHPHNDLSVDPELLGPIDVAARDEVIIGRVQADASRPGGYWIWAVMDNLTRGGALNALEILEALGVSVVH